MIGSIAWRPTMVEDIQSKQCGRLNTARIGIMLHFDASKNDRASLNWFKDPACRVSYNNLVMDDGTYAIIAGADKRAWHAGACRPSSERLKYTDANSAFYGVAIASNEKVECTSLQMLTAAWLCWRYFQTHGWPLTETWRITGHDSEAWPRGRKTDPTGPDPLNPILSVENIRRLLPLFVP